jgi:dihydroorotate dehydrogenase
VDLYTTLLRPLLFRFSDPEVAHRTTIATLGHLGDRGLAARIAPLFRYDDPGLRVKLWGLEFPNPIGVAAGLDKNGEAVLAWEHLGFGFVEVGTVTRHPQPGNPRPRLFRLGADSAVINRMGFNNGGADALAEHLTTRRPGIPLGINLGKSKMTPLEEAADDYLYSFQRLYPFGDYFVVNVSSPNTPGLRDLQQADRLGEILETLQAANTAGKPLLVKIAPDLDWPAIDAVIDLCGRYRLAGIIATNTTIRRDGLKTKIDEAGGLSGAPLRERSTAVIAHIHRATAGQLPIVGVGGIFTGTDAQEKRAAGASLLQVYTGWIYEGPWMLRRLLGHLSRHQIQDPKDTNSVATT